ncbi:MAG TPA: preprotein translocase subunit SecE [Rhizomicrobium sp.]|nr:preprotein translocase subunit SecE [Rhizomicrobium sp.]
MAEASRKSADDTTGSLPAPARSSGGIVQFVRDVKREAIDKVTWPTIRETRLTTVVVFIMVGLMMLFFYAVDFLFTMAEGWLIGGFK